jgi:hypothetical protein
VAQPPGPHRRILSWLREHSSQGEVDPHKASSQRRSAERDVLKSRHPFGASCSQSLKSGRGRRRIASLIRHCPFNDGQSKNHREGKDSTQHRRTDSAAFAPSSKGSFPVSLGPFAELPLVSWPSISPLSNCFLRCPLAAVSARPMSHLQTTKAAAVEVHSARCNLA